MYIGWNDRIWRGYDVQRGWTELKGCFSRTEKSADTVCHRNHIHISFTWDGASGRTSFWTGQAMDAPFCPRARSSATTPHPVPRGPLMSIDPVRVLNTRTQVGLTQRCRLQQDRFSGDSRRIFAKVLGVGGVPTTGVSAVVVRVTAWDANAPSRLRVWSPGQGSSSSVVRVPINGTASGQTIVPVASDGTIAVANQAGAADVTIDVLGYYGLEGDPVEIPDPISVDPPPADTAPTPQPVTPEQTPVPDSGFIALGTRLAYASAENGGALQPREARTIALPGVPADASVALVTVTTTDATKRGFLRIGATGDKPTAKLRVRKQRETTNVVMLPVTNGAVTVTNSKRPEVQVRLAVHGYSTSAKPPTAVAHPASTLFKGRVNAGEVSVIKAAGQVGLPKKKRLSAVLLRVTTKGREAGTVTIAAHGLPAAETQTIPMLGKERTVTWLLVPTNADGQISMSATVRGTVRGEVVGFLR